MCDIIHKIDMSFRFQRVFFILGRPISLIGGEVPGQGNVYVNGRPVCDYGWNIIAGKVAWRHLGYSDVLEIKFGEHDTYFNKWSL